MHAGCGVLVQFLMCPHVSLQSGAAGCCGHLIIAYEDYGTCEECRA